MTEEMKLFLVSLQEWVEKGHPEGGLPNSPKYSNRDSICFNAEYFADWHVEVEKLKGIDKAEEIYESLSFEMEDHLPDEGTDIPFNDGDRDYSDEMVEGKHYTNTKRLNWLKEITDKIKSGAYNDN